MDSDMPQLTVENCELLEELGLLGPLIQGRKRKISSSFLTPSHSSGSRSSSDTSTRSAALTYASPVSLVSSKPTIELPSGLFGIPYLRYLGLDDNAATSVHEQFLLKDPNCPDIELDWALGYLTKLTLPQFQAMADRQRLQHLGIDSELIEVLYRTEFEDIRKTENIIDWIRITFRGRHNALETILTRTSEYADRVHAARRQPDAKKLKIEGPMAGADIASIAIFSPDMKDVELSDNFPVAHTTIGTKHYVSDANWVCIYKGKGAKETIVSEEIIDENGNINMGVLETYRGSDFNSSALALYFTDDIKVAEIYRQYAAERVKHQHTYIVTIRLKREWFVSLRHAEIYYGHEWKEFVWRCRKAQRPPLPPKFDRYTKNIDVLTGHIAKAPSQVTTKIKAEDVQTKISEDSVLYVESGDRQKKAIQIVFMTAEVSDKLAEQAKGQLELQVHRPISSFNK